MAFFPQCLSTSLQNITLFLFCAKMHLELSSLLQTAMSQLLFLHTKAIRDLLLTSVCIFQG